MESIIIYKPVNVGREKIDNIGGIYTDITYKALIEEYEIPEENILLYIPFKISGKTYQERKADLQDKAITWSNDLNLYPCWSYGELADISEFFETNARRYGLLQEFKENAIC